MGWGEAQGPTISDNRVAGVQRELAAQTELVDQFRWVVENSDGVVGVDADGAPWHLDWPDLLALAVPAWTVTP